MTEQMKPSESDPTRKKEENDQADSPADPGKNNPATRLETIALGVYLVLMTFIVVLGIYHWWPVCEPLAAPGVQAGQRPPQTSETIILTPKSGPIEGKNLVTIIGSGFAAGVTTVSFGTEVIQLDPTNVSATSIVVTAPAHAPGPVDVIIKKKPGDPDAVTRYWYLAAPLSVTAVAPSSGLVTGGASIKIIGTGFVEEAKVTFGGKPSEKVAVESATSITAALPAHSAGKVEVVVTNGTGQETMKSDAFTYICAGPTGSGALLMIICAGALGGCLHGMRSLVGFVGGRQFLRSWILFYVLLPFTSSMIALVYYLIFRAGLYSPEKAESSTASEAAFMLGLAVLVGLFSEAATEKLKKIALAMFTEPPPRPDKLQSPSLDLQRLTPVKGSTEGGTPVTVKGRGFPDTAEVTFDGLKATVVSRTGDTTIAITTPKHAAGPVNVEVRNPADGKTSKLSGGFTYVEPPPIQDPAQPLPGPTITGVNPKKGPAGTTVTIGGTGFDASGVQLGGLKATVVSATAESIVVTTPSHDPGEVDIVVTNKDKKTVKWDGKFTYE